MLTRFVARIVLRPVLIALSLLTLCFTVLANAQGFSVSPIRIETEILSGRDIDIPIKLSNSTDSRLFEISVQRVELLQSDDGSWRVAEPHSDLLPLGHKSNFDWFKDISKKASIGPQQSAEIVLSGRVPRAASGTYVSALLVTSNEQGDAGDAVKLRFQFLVPIILTIAGRPSRQSITLDNLGLFLKQPNLAITPNAVSSVVALAALKNKGESYARLTGSMRIDRQTEGGWRFVTNAPLSKRAILPGAALTLRAPLGRSLPTGTYKLTGYLEVDGRRLPRMTVTLDFVGDDALTGVAYDAQIEVTPKAVEIAARRGALRNMAVKITNTSETDITVDVETQIPQVLATSAMGDLLGTEISAAEWVKASPGKFKLRAGATRNIRVVSRLPEDAPDHAYFFAELSVAASNSDAQAAGTTIVPIVIANNPDATEPELTIESVSVSQDDTSERYFVHLKAINTGKMHLRPEPVVSLIEGDGKLVKSISVEGQNGLMIPMSVWDYSGAINLSEVKNGSYTLRTVLRANGNNITTSDHSVDISTNKSGLKTLEFTD